MNHNDEKIIFHIDMDAFFTSIEQRDNPSWKGKPVIVGALPGNRGVVAAASYEARKFGVHSALPISQAYARCPQGVYIRPRMSLYAEVSDQVIEVFRSFSPRIEQLSVDEAFMDMSGTGKLWGPPRSAAEKLSRKIKQTVQLTASIGIARNKFLAKLASDMNKPNGITEVPFDQDTVVAWMAPLAVSKIWGVGIKSQQQLNALGITTIGQLQQVSRQKLEERFGKQGISLYNLCRGIDSREIEEPQKSKSISREHTFNTDSFDKEEWFRTILTLARDVASRTRKEELKGRTVCLTYRTPDFSRHSRRTTLDQPTDLAKEIFAHASRLLNLELPVLKAVRLIGVGITNFDTVLQTDLFEDTRAQKQWQASEHAMDILSERFGDDVVVRAREVRKKKNG